MSWWSDGIYTTIPSHSGADDKTEKSKRKNWSQEAHKKTDKTTTELKRNEGDIMYNNTGDVQRHLNRKTQNSWLFYTSLIFKIKISNYFLFFSYINISVRGWSSLALHHRPFIHFGCKKIHFILFVYKEVPQLQPSEKKNYNLYEKNEYPHPMPRSFSSAQFANAGTGRAVRSQILMRSLFIFLLLLCQRIKMQSI